MLGLAVDLGGSHATCAIVRDDKLIARSTLQIHEHADGCHFGGVMREIADHLKQLCLETGIASGEAAGLVFGFPGIVDSRAAKIVATNKKFDQALSFDFAAWGHDHLQLTVVLENDARLALLGEHYCGAAHGANDVVLVTLGTGIGAAAMLGGKLLRGEQDRAGCLGGHIPVVMGGRLCGCGNLGCAEAEASTWALPLICKDDPGFAQSALAAQQNIDFAILFQYADQGDAVARKVLARCCQVWSTLAIALIHVYAPQVLLFGGSVMERKDEILGAICPYVEKHAWSPGGVRVLAAALGSSASLYGTIPRLCEASC